MVEKVRVCHKLLGLFNNIPHDFFLEFFNIIRNQHSFNKLLSILKTNH
jgi:hypothetical protein